LSGIPLLFTAVSIVSATSVPRNSHLKAPFARQLQDKEAASDDLPSHIEIKDDNGVGLPIQLAVIPAWEIFLGFSDHQKLIKGRMTLNTVYPPSAHQFVSRPDLVVDLENFATGEKHLLGTVTLWDPIAGEEMISASKVYVGEFSQSLTSFEMSCYPFDYKEVFFRIGLQKPADAVFTLTLVCAGEGSVSGIDPVSNLTMCTWPAPGSYVGFQWQNFTCRSIDTALIECTMKGIRQSQPLITAYLWPSIVYSLMGFLAFGLDVRFAMPRIATTMLALVSLTNLRNQVLTLVPSSGDTSWMEEYFLIAVTFMFLNLVGHTTSFYLESVGHLQMQKMVNKVNLWGMLSIFILVVLARLHVRDCALVDQVQSGAWVGVSSVVVVFVFVFLAWYYRTAFKELCQKIKDLPSKGRSDWHLDHPQEATV